MSKTKSSSKKGGNLFMCFRQEEVDPDVSGRVESVVTYIAMRKKGNSHVVLPAADEEDTGIKKSGSRRFSMAVTKKSKKGKSDTKSSSKLISESARFNYQVSTNNDDFDYGQRILSRSVSALATSSALAIANTNSSGTTSTLCSSCSSSLITETTPFVGSDSAKLVKYDRGYESCDCGLVLMILSLFVLVFWGKLCAIFCTTTWLFLMPRLMMPVKKSSTSSSAKSNSSTSSSSSSECKSPEDCKGRNTLRLK
ncbi:uncharacterized protein LOC133821754 [Humulus lupulus]|uniref:uncharacterized protein LOC133821754 n=1 Tax=Humulus lupulus TaxID=3486 RepID=UPI002B411393|nr:uncharacterized protein LOC133821754 [Humulus lupulus]